MNRVACENNKNHTDTYMMNWEIHCNECNSEDQYLRKHTKGAGAFIIIGLILLGILETVLNCVRG